MKINFFTLTLLTVATFALTGCSREPSQADLQRLYEQQVQGTNSLIHKFAGGEKPALKIKTFDKIDCQKIQDSKDYHCRFQVNMDIPFLGEQQHSDAMTVTKGENGWAVVD